MKTQHPSDPFRMRALSYNIHGCMDARRRVKPQNMKRIISQFNADLIALQEVDGPTSMNPSPNQAMLISRALNHNYVYFPTDE